MVHGDFFIRQVNVTNSCVLQCVHQFCRDISKETRVIFTHLDNFCSFLKCDVR